jgi:hypothetical protein
MTSAKDYFEQHYRTDFEQFGADSLCGANLAEIMRPDRRARFTGLAEFILCQFALNLLNQAIYTHLSQHRSAWRSFTAPFGNTLFCFSGHGMASHAPDSILRFAQSPMTGSLAAPISFSREQLADYSRYFFRDYVSHFADTLGDPSFTVDTFTLAISHDFDCRASLLTSSGWESSHVTELLDYATAKA